MDVPTKSITEISPGSIKRTQIKQHIVEIISDSGEGAQKAGQSLGAISAKMGNGVWTVEIIPSEIQPPPRTVEGASGIRIRIGSETMTNSGDKADLIVAFNEVIPYSRIEQNAYKKGTYLLLESKWRDDISEEIRENYKRAVIDFKKKGFKLYEIPMEEECLKLVKNARKGKNMWVLGMLCYIYDRDINLAIDQIKYIFRKKNQAIIDTNIKLLMAGYNWSEENLNFSYSIPLIKPDHEIVVMNGNEALGFGILAAGIEVVSMYPITPASSVSHFLAERIHRAGGRIHQAEDEIAAIGFAIGSSFAGKTAVTITSGPGLALKTEFIGLAIMAEVPLVIINVQRGGPSTGLPTKVEQSDLLSVLYGQPGDAPKIVMAAATIEECFQFPIIARQIAEAYRTPVFILSDANLATGVQPFKRPYPSKEWLSTPIDQSGWKEDAFPFSWDEKTGLSRRPIPGQKGGEYTLTGLAHNDKGSVSYNPENNQYAMSMRSKKITTFKKTLKEPVVFGDTSGDLLIVGWGSTYGAIREAVDKAREGGAKVSCLHLRFLSPLEPGLKPIFKMFKKIITIELNYSDDKSDPGMDKENLRYSQLALILRAQTLMDVNSFSNVYGRPLRPERIYNMIQKELQIN